MLSIEQLFTLACTGNIAELEKYYKNGGEKNVRYQRFGAEHSLIMGAFRNCQFATVDYLKSQGETLTAEEEDAMRVQLRRLETANQLVGHPAKKKIREPER